MTEAAEMRYWTFNVDTCRFERTTSEAALKKADVAVINDDIDIQSFAIRAAESLAQRRTSGCSRCRI